MLLMTRWIAFLGIVLCLVAGVQIGVSAPASGGGKGSIMLVSNRASPGDLYAINADGTGLKKLVANVGSAQWSPDGSRIAFSRGRYGSVYVIRADGSGLRRIAASGTADGYSWAPDRPRLAISGSEGVRLPYFAATAR